MLKKFKQIAFLEGTSLLLLLFVAMPLKYIWKLPQMVEVVGMLHGILFIVYVITAILVFFKYKWKIKTLVIVMLGSVIPFGAFYIEKKYLTV